MAATSLPLDRQGTNPTNQFPAEVITINLNVDRSVWPANHPFFANDGYFQVEGRQGSGAWSVLTEGTEFSYGAPFTSESVASGKEIFSYIIITTENIDEVRFKYKSLGYHVDQTVIDEIASLQNAGRLDRSSVTSWTQVKGISPSYAVATDSNVVGRTYEEIIKVQLDAMLAYLQAPDSTTTVQASDLTAINLQLGSKASITQVRELLAQPTGTSVTAAGDDINTEVYRFPNSVTAISGLVHSTAESSNVINLVGFRAHRTSSSGAWVVVTDSVANANGVPTISVSTSGSEFVVNAKTAGSTYTYRFKLLSRMDGV